MSRILIGLLGVFSLGIAAVIFICRRAVDQVLRDFSLDYSG